MGSAWTTVTPATTSPHRSQTQLFAATREPVATSRQAFLQTAAALAVGTVAVASGAPLALAEETLPSGVSYEVVKTGKGPKPNLGELVGIRFAAYYGDTKIDDIYDTPEPYYTRIGSGGLIKGVESTLPYMQLGDRWKLKIPVRLLLHLRVQNEGTNEIMFYTMR